ncbi:PA14 domain-containing protein [Agitococcus lubricus]|uniref:PA14 domain-containing protein n=1 Tax=Agitococcus lubricus TaxID=1077255 RepID=A0A2T5IUI0_9GAMM|nr:PA14 domain-containing protein [Agitococcus lubricus]PTQ87534.1 PA14 domain-containing protein [Agitococcus lubricus]
MTVTRFSWTVLSSTLILCACNNNHDAGLSSKNTSASIATQQITVTPSLGKITNANVILRNARSGAEIGKGNTGSSGFVVFNIPKTVDTIVVEVSGNSSAQYFDEAKGVQNFPSNVTLRAASSVVTNTHLGVSILTEAAVQRAESLPDGLSQVSNINQANTEVGQALGMSNITQAPTLIGSDTDYQQLQDDAASRYALQLAALVKAASDKVSGNTPALALLDKLAKDLSDGLLDGKTGSSPLSDIPYAELASVFAASWQLAMQDIVNSLANNAVQQALTTQVINNVDVKDVINGEIVDGDGVFGGEDKKPWKGEIFLLAEGTPKLPDFSQLSAIGTLFTEQINVPEQSFDAPFPGVPSNRFEWFGVRYQGPLTVKADGSYQFELRSDDGSKLYIDNQLVIDNDYTHAPYSVGNTMQLTKGVHTLRVEYFQGPRYQVALQLFGYKVGTPKQLLTPMLE